jgi:hypothetical protein
MVRFLYVRKKVFAMMVLKWLTGRLRLLTWRLGLAAG